MNLFELFVKIGVDDQASDKVSSLSSKLGNGLKTAAKVGAAAITAVTKATAAMTTALMKGVSQTAEYGDNIDKMSQKMGMTAEAYQEWDAVMQHSGTSIESLQASMKTLANAVEKGNGAFERLGISQEEIAKMSNEELFSATITSLQKVENETERTYLAGQLLGRGATELGALLNTSAEDTQAMKDRVHELGGVMSDEAVKAAAAYQDSLQDMKTAFSGLSRGLTSEFMPAVTTIMDGLTEIFGGDGESGITLVTEGVSGLIDNINAMIPQVLETGEAIIDYLLGAIMENVSSLLSAGIEVVSEILFGIVEYIPVLATGAIEILNQIVDSIVDNSPMLLTAALETIMALANGIAESLPELIPTIVDVVLQIVETLVDNVDMLVDASIAIITRLADGLVEALPEIANVAIGIIETLAKGIVENTPQLLSNGVKMLADFSANLRENLGTIVDAGIDTLLKFVDGIVEAMPDLIAYVPEIVSNIANIINDNAPKLVLAAAKIIWKLVVGLIDNIPVIIQNLPKIISAIVDTILAFNWVNLGSSIIKGLGNGLKGMVSFVKNIGNQIVNAIKGGFSNLPSQMINIGKNIVSGLWNGIKSMISWLGSKIKGFAGGIVSAAKNALGIRSPSRVFRDQIGKQMAAGIGVGWEDEFDKVKSDIEGSLSFDNASVGINASIRKVGEENFGHTYGSTTIGNVTINIDGAKYSDENSLAEAMAEALQNMTDRRAAVYA